MFDGKANRTEVDVQTSGIAGGWFQGRSYNNQLQQPKNIGLGWNWEIANWPYLQTSNLPDSDFALMGDSNGITWFKSDGSGGYDTLNASKKKLTYDSVNSVYYISDGDGTVTVFNGGSHPTRPYCFKQRTTPGGKSITVVDEDADRILQTEAQDDVAGETVRENYIYLFYDSTHTNAYQTERVTVRRKTGSGSWEEILKAEYTYYDGTESNGKHDDLKTVKTYNNDGSNWVLTGTTYYRYYTGNDEHLLKYVVGPEAWQKLVDNSYDPLAVSDSILAQFADSYFEYDSENRVTKEVTNAGSRTYTIAYYNNPLFENNSQVDPINNIWKRRTTVTYPDGHKTIVYAGGRGYEIFRIERSADDSQEWMYFTHYDLEGRVLFRAHPSAITGYNELYPDLVGLFGFSAPGYLDLNDGLYEVNEFYYTTGSGAAYGYLKSSGVQQGYNGTYIKQWELQYADGRTANGATVYPLSKEIVYPDASNQNTTVETSYSYTWYSGTTQVAEKTITLPVVSTGQNGSGTADERKEYYDLDGRLIWTEDERGLMNYTKIDKKTGAPERFYQDVDTSTLSSSVVPSGWSNSGDNIITDYQADDLGRITEELGPAHDVDLDGVKRTVRRAKWTVYDDVNNRVTRASGYVYGSTEVLVNPVAIFVTDFRGNLLEEIQATRASTSGKLLDTDTFNQSSYVRWTTYQYTDCCKLASRRDYHTIPSSGEGSEGDNYDLTQYGYDLADRRNRTVLPGAPGSTITQKVFDILGRLIGVWVGTDDTNATETDPTGGGATNNNMVLVTSYEYDDGNDMSDWNLTKETQHVSATDTRVTEYDYDWRNRRVAVHKELGQTQKFTLDNLSRIIQTDRVLIATGSSSSSSSSAPQETLIGRSSVNYDDRGRIYKRTYYAVDPDTGTVGESLSDHYWFDESGNLVKEQFAGTELLTKTQYDILGRAIEVRKGYEVTGAGGIEDVLFEQSLFTYDDAGDRLLTEHRRRHHDTDETITGPIGGPQSTTAPRGRISYLAQWSDPLGRLIASADYGTNGGSSFTRPDLIPSRSDTVLVTTQDYDDTGLISETVDPAGMVTAIEYDNRGRRITTIENVVAASSSSSSSGSASSSSSSGGGSCTPNDENRTTRLTYTADGQIAKLTAENSQTGDQVTTYTYGTTLTESEIATSHLLRRTQYPDSTGTSDSVEQTYNRQQQITSTTDQNGTVKEFDFDKLGRPVEDRVTTLGSGVDGSVRRLSATYEVRGMVETLSSHDNATVGTGNVVNQMENVYNDFGQLITQYLEHNGAVNTSTTPKVQYSYADGSSGYIRVTSLTYPNGREIGYDYSGTTNGKLNRLTKFIDDDVSSTTLAEYKYLGLGRVIDTQYQEPAVELSHHGLITVNGESVASYDGLDRFDRVIDHHWHAGSTDLSRIKYGYDRASNRVWREDTVAGAAGKHFDELYAYDGLHRLQNAQRGSLNANKDAVTSLQHEHDWCLDPLGNWKGFKADADGDATWDLEQTRTANKVNEVTDVSENTGASWATPAYDAAGNMTTVPKPADPTGSFTATYDAWNRLVKLVDGANTVAEYEYDPRNYRLIAKNYASGTLDETRHYYYSSAWQVLEERVDSSSDADRLYLWGIRYIDDCVFRERDTNADGVLDERLYTLQDANWNVTALTDDSGTVQERFAYTAYGTPSFFDASWTSRSSSSYDWETLYAGYRWDAGSGLFGVRHRFFNPSLGVWINRDPIGYVNGPNLYQYAESQPFGSIDPLGLGWLSVIGHFAAGIVVGAAIGVAIGVAAAALSPVAAAVVVGAAVITGIGHVAALGVRAYYGDLTADEAAFAAGTFVGGGAGYRFGYTGYASGREFCIGRCRIAPFGNRTGHPTGRFPHYHRATPDPNNPGQSMPGQGIGRHRPWDTKSTDTGFEDRF